ncbi:FkbM family methyltransferase [Campylobacter sp. VicNov18]|uniref:FkbM family methyltransferase n=1 Tax=Campylobacter bilis TaxID=2691918 RepID=UPI00130E3CC5|nr:FkbM family methyltransferase [Campylobacter bilis]MPV63621.1 FkbM family methyltransferase [Campylobacter hepaticus]MBM0637121.1 FkbM family methyltransferase [Campylobacter bilis]MCC8277720.1 FkbM family methyltransferase [Campylobacter bilis]MCC8299329.1 FkbM family methyltransferase [Campylobacter bilis]MCC8300629.1 FkbM family methyltransferase [Campylobacter bilis]
MEQEVILGCLNHIKAFKPILQIEIIKSNTQDIINILENLEYKIFQCGINILAIYKDPAINHLKTSNP